MTSDRVLCVQCAIPLPPVAKYCRHCGVSQTEPVPNSFYPLPKVVAKETPDPAVQTPAPASVEGERLEPKLGEPAPKPLLGSVSASELGLEPKPAPQPEPEPEPALAMKCHSCGEDLPHSLQVCFQHSPWLSDRVVQRMDQARQAANAAYAHVEQLEKRLKTRVR
jgi:hypothetical protein